jgi:hypothetical protein
MVVQTTVRGSTSTTVKEMVEEKGIVPERSEWFRSSPFTSTSRGVLWLDWWRSGLTTQHVYCVRQHRRAHVGRLRVR